MSEFNELFDDHLFNIDETKEKTVKLKEGERRMVSILFADVKGFTALSEKLDHEDVQILMDHIMKIFTHSVEIHGGYVDKYTGDQIMALFGAKRASEVDTERSITTGLDMLHKLKKFNTIAAKSEKYKKLNIDFRIRVGIHTGMVTTGKIGKEREGDYTVYGDAVNLASRMESNAPVNSIMIPEYTMNLVRGLFKFEDNGDIQVKGKTEPISVHLVKSKLDKKLSYTTPFIGRDSELNELDRIYSNSNKYFKLGITEKLSLIGIHSEAGVGKSRLINEFLNNATKMKDEMFCIGTCSNISSQPYHLFTTLIKDAFDISIIDNSDITSKKFEDGLVDLKNNNPDKSDRIDNVKSFLGFLIGLKYEDHRLKDKNELTNHFKIALRIFLECLCTAANKKEKSYIIIFEDLHWIDKMSIEVLEYILQTFNIQDKRNKNKISLPLFICTFRNEYSMDKSLIANSKFFDINLLNLDQNSSLELIKSISKDVGLDKDKSNELYVKSNGNPFFIEEWVNLINDSKSADSIDPSREVKNEYIIPNTLNSLILSRIDTLEKDLKLLLQKATIIGEDFFIKILSLLEKKLGSSDDVTKPVDDLESENFILHYLKEIDHYRFKHILTRDVAYSTILKSNKKILHSAVADVIEENFSDIIEKFYYDLAIHYDSCDNHDKAIEYLKKSGYKYNEIIDKKSAYKCFNRIIDIIKTNSLDYLDIYYECKINCIEIHSFQGDTEAAITLVEELETEDIPDRLIGKFYYFSGIAYEAIRNNTKSLEYFNKSLEIHLNNNNSDMVSDIYVRLGLVFINTGEYETSMKNLEKAISLYKENKNILELSSAYGTVGNIFLFQGKFEKAYKIFEKQYEISKKYDSRMNIQVSLGNLALIDNIHGKFSKALNKFNELLINSEEINDRMNICKTYGNIGIAHKNLNEYDLAIENFNEQIKIAEDSNYKGQLAFANINKGIAFHKSGDFKNSLKCYDCSKNIIDEINDNNAKSLFYGNIGNLLLDKGEFTSAIEAFENAIKIFKKLDNQRGINLARLKISEINFLNDKFSEAMKGMSDISNHFKEINDAPYYSMSLMLHAKIKRKSKSYKEAHNLLDSAIEINKKLNDSNLYNESVIEKLIVSLESGYDTENTIKNIKTLLNENISDEHKGYIMFHLNEFEPKEFSNIRVIEFYNNLYKGNPKFIYKKHIDQLN